MIAIFVLILALGLMTINLPIAFCTGLATAAGILVMGKFSLEILAQKMVTALDSFTFIAIPLFILTGRLMALGGITKDLIRLSTALVGFLRGGLAYINIVASMFFAGITGSASSDTASIGAILIPAMIEKKYSKEFTVAVTATSSTIGIVIPPSIPMVIYGVAAAESIGKLFLAGFIPGVMIGFALMLVTWIHSRRHNYPVETTFNLKEIVISILRSLPALMTVVILLGGIISGVFTPTEAAGIAVLYSFLLGLFYYRELKLKDIPGILLEVGITTGIVALMIATATWMGYLFAIERVPHTISQFIISLSSSKIVIILLINVLLLFIGMWMDLAPAMIIFTPILLPIAQAIGINTVQFGILMVINLGIGLFTPPVGVCLFMACAIAKTSITSVIKDLFPFFLSMVIVLLLVSYIPSISLFLPSLFMGK